MSRITLPPDLAERRRELVEEILAVERSIQDSLDAIKDEVSYHPRRLKTCIAWYNDLSRKARELQLEIHSEYIRQTGTYFIIEDGHFDVEVPEIKIPELRDFLGSAKECITTDLHYVEP